jgi:hypothetical protein
MARPHERPRLSEDDKALIADFGGWRTFVSKVDQARRAAFLAEVQAGRPVPREELARDAWKRHVLVKATRAGDIDPDDTALGLDEAMREYLRDQTGRPLKNPEPWWLRRAGQAHAATLRECAMASLKLRRSRRARVPLGVARTRRREHRPRPAARRCNRETRAGPDEPASSRRRRRPACKRTGR